MEEIKTVYYYIYNLITTYFLPQETALKGWESIIVIICAAISLAVFWAFIARPFWWFFKYGLWGGSKKNRRLNNWDD